MDVSEAGIQAGLTLARQAGLRAESAWWQSPRACAYGSFLGKFAHTPNLDRLAKGGMLFKNGLVTNSICTPARAAILTGQYSHKNGVYTPPVVDLRVA